MACWNCTSSPFRDITRAMAKAAAAKLRNVGALSTAVNWSARASICETCPLRVVRRGVSYCGTPFLQKVDRDQALEGCGCPTREKAKSPEEHCPIDRRHQPADETRGRCNCKWCASAQDAVTIERDLVRH